MSDPRKHVGVIISLVVIVGLSTPTAAEQATIREGTALAKLVAEVSTNTPEITVAAAAPPSSTFRPGSRPIIAATIPSFPRPRFSSIRPAAIRWC